MFELNLAITDVPQNLTQDGIHEARLLFARDSLGVLDRLVYSGIFSCGGSIDKLIHPHPDDVEQVWRYPLHRPT